MARNFLWDPIEDNVIAEFDDDGNLLVDYTTEPELYGNVISQHRDGETNVFYSDTQGSTVAVTNQAGDVVATRAYSVYGETTETFGELIFPFQYIGQKGYYCDTETDTTYVRARIYKPAIARWLSVDPLFSRKETGLLDLENASMNLIESYVYGHNAATGSIDPSGLYVIRTTGQNVCAPKYVLCINAILAIIRSILITRSDCFTRTIPRDEAVDCSRCRSSLTQCIIATIDSSIEMRCDVDRGRNAATDGDCVKSKNKARKGREEKVKLEPDASCVECDDELLKNSFIVFSTSETSTMPKVGSVCSFTGITTRAMRDFARSTVHELAHNCVAPHADPVKHIVDEHRRPDAQTISNDFIRNCWP